MSYLSTTLDQPFDFNVSLRSDPTEAPSHIITLEDNLRPLTLHNNKLPLLPPPNPYSSETREAILKWEDLNRRKLYGVKLPAEMYLRAAVERLEEVKLLRRREMKEELHETLELATSTENGISAETSLQREEQDLTLENTALEAILNFIRGESEPGLWASYRISVRLAHGMGLAEGYHVANGLRVPDIPLPPK